MNRVNFFSVSITLFCTFHFNQLSVCSVINGFSYFMIISPFISIIATAEGKWFGEEEHVLPPFKISRLVYFPVNRMYNMVINTTYLQISELYTCISLCTHKLGLPVIHMTSKLFKGSPNKT